MFWFFLICALCTTTCIEPRTIDKDRAVFYTQETVNGMTFIQRREWIEGEYREKCFINDEAVDVDQFHTSILDAEREEARQRREHDNAMQDASYHEHLRMRANIMHRLISDHVHTMRYYTDILASYSLKQYYAFHGDTIADNRIYTYIVETLLPKAESLSSDTSDIVSLSTLLHEIESYLPRLKQFYFDTIQRAIDTCHDTKQLKELLTLIS